MSGIEFLSRENLSTFIEGSKLRIDDFVIAAMDVAEEVHGSVSREDKSSSFLESHTWPVTKDVINHLLAEDRNITSVEIASAILHDILEDNDKILDWYRTKDYGFDAYLRFEERQLARFHDYCSILSTAEYDVKAIKLADRINNMNFI